MDKNKVGISSCRRSPSCGLKDVKVYTASGPVSDRGTGIFARAFLERFPHLPVIDNERLHDLTWQNKFVQKVRDYKYRQDFLEQD